MMTWSLPLLPTNGLDRSLHAPVLVGLVFVTFFAEAFGWTYAGLVVPGYLAATLAAAPITAILVFVEGWLTHVAVAAIARFIPERTYAWSTAFGRERFFLYIVMAIVVRLFVEGSLVPWATSRYQLTHSRELYSIGLVLVPLVANVFWSSGFLHAGPRLGVLSGLTYLVVDFGLLRHTNFSLSRFQVANESVALHFLDTPKAYLLLLVGAMLGARGNVKYGWDYNGILVPALLAVAWYEPVKLVGTAVEAVAVYLLARFLSNVRPFSRLTLVGGRRMLFVGIVGFALKVATGHVLAQLKPELEITEYLGFGYILPSLLAVKMWNKLRIGIVLMPTLQVSLVAFLTGNALGFVLNWTTDRLQPKAREVVPIEQPSSIALAWLLAQNAPPHRPGDCRHRLQPEILVGVVERTILRGFPDRQDLLALDALDLQAVSNGSRWLLIVPKRQATSVCASLRLALAREYAQRNPSLALVANTAQYGSPTAVAALSIAEATSAPLVIGLAQPASADRGEQQLIEQFAAHFTLIAFTADKASPNLLRVAGTVPSALELDRISELVESPVALRFVDAPTLERTTLSLSDDATVRVASRYLGSSDVESWSGPLRRNIQSRAEELVGQTYRSPTRSELLLLSSVVLPAIESPTAPNAWTLSVAKALGYRVAESTHQGELARILYEPQAFDRRGNATWIVRPVARRALTVEVPAPLWELGVLSYGLALFDMTDARHLLLAGARPDTSPDGSSDPRKAAGRSSYFQHIHESVLGRGDAVVALHAIRPDVPVTQDVLAEATAPVLAPEQRSKLAVDILELLASGGLRSDHFAATPDQSSIGAQFDPAFAFAERFTPEKMLRLWFSAKARAAVTSVPPSMDSFRRISDRSPQELDVAQWTATRLHLSQRSHDPATSTPACDLDQVASTVKTWLREGNPYARLDAQRLGNRCEWHCYIDAPTGIPWLILLSGIEARLVPLHGAVAASNQADVGRELTQLRRALNLGTSTLRTGGE